ncbi:S-adenosyl-L-methionine-dependent methyltransferase [Rhypophila sp. PSN 637]
MDTILAQLRTLATKVSDDGRIKLLNALRDLQLSIETPADSLNRFAGLHLEITAARIGEDLKLFEILSNAANPLTIEELASNTGAAPLLISRLARYLASVGQITEVSTGTFTANKLTRTLAEPGYRGGIYHFFDNVGPVFQALPDFLAETKYQDVTSASATAFQKAFPEAGPLPAFMWLPTQPERFGHLQQVMTVNGAGASAPWFVAFPFAEQAFSSSSPTTETVLVDVGGGFGHQCLGLMGAFGDKLGGKLVLQDLPQTIAMFPPPLRGGLDASGVKVQEHDFFKEQPVKGARFYYLRNILHDWPDDKCLEILARLKEAFGPESQILIDEMVLPDRGVPWQAASIDLTMMASLGSRERTSGEWKSLLDKAGLEILRFDTYAPGRLDSVIQVGRKK